MNSLFASIDVASKFNLNFPVAFATARSKPVVLKVVDCTNLWYYNHCASPSVRGQLVQMLITLEPHGIL